MKRLLMILVAGTFIFTACNPSQQQETENAADSLQREMEEEVDTAGRKIDSLGDTIKDAAGDLINEAGETLEKAGEKLKKEGENTSGN